MATKPKGGGAKGLSGRATKKKNFLFAASLTCVSGSVFYIISNGGLQIVASNNPPINYYKTRNSHKLYHGYYKYMFKVKYKDDLKRLG